MSKTCRSRGGDDAWNGFAVWSRSQCAADEPGADSGVLGARAPRDGVSAMTLEAVAREAGLSKGGLLYHFASKDELIAAMLQHHAAADSEDGRIADGSGPESPGDAGSSPLM